MPVQRQYRYTDRLASTLTLTLVARRKFKVALSQPQSRTKSALAEVIMSRL